MQQDKGGRAASLWALGKLRIVSAGKEIEVATVSPAQSLPEAFSSDIPRIYPSGSFPKSTLLVSSPADLACGEATSAPTVACSLRAG